MQDKTKLSHEALAESTQSDLIEIERRLAELGYDKLLRRAKTAHYILDDIEEKLSDTGAITFRSVGGDK